MGLLEHYGDISVLYLWRIGVRTTFQDFGGCMSFLCFLKQWSMRRIFRGKQINRLRLIACMIILGEKMCRMFNMISGLSRCFIDFFHAVYRRWNLILCILELGSVAVSTLRLETTCGLWISSKQQNRPSRKKWQSFSHWFHPICLAEILTGLCGGAIFHYLFIYFLNLQWSGYATDEASLFRAQPVVAATVAVNMSNRVSHVEQVWRSDAVELCCFQLFFFQQKELL